MSRIFTPKVVTANALLEGDVVYLAEDGAWVRRLDEAELIEDEAIAQLRLIDAQSQPDRVVGPYLAEARASQQGPVPGHFREGFRAAGPSNRNHGKQADLTDV
ncbi:DUF2849 domain-containing protein [Acidimangrovimonas sediminis]|uniref:DUF2849 domain-containing protein n=1 Tax=Acidimangrovimonas sediminis TaxID=2056283 RepID=UPI000C7FC7C7|nr:DUF2849 domain-containing protein [Acidimangrovimonas sediminis]